MIEAVLSAVRAYIQNKKVKTQKKELSKTPETLMVSLPSPSPLTVTPPLPPAIPASLPQQQFTYGTTTTITTPTQPQTSNRLKV